jgi:hypothetical protein
MIKRLLFFVAVVFSMDCQSQKMDDFVAMEYRGMSNLIYRVYVTKTAVIGVKVNGYITVRNALGAGYTVPDVYLNNPEAYVDPDMELKYRNENIESNYILDVDEENFIILKRDIKKCYLNKKKKFGMGYYPYSGRIIIESPKTKRNPRKKRDLILVGDQSAQTILSLINTQFTLEK